MSIPQCQSINQPSAHLHIYMISTHVNHLYISKYIHGDISILFESDSYSKMQEMHHQFKMIRILGAKELSDLESRGWLLVDMKMEWDKYREIVTEILGKSVQKKPLFNDPNKSIIFF